MRLLDEVYPPESFLAPRAAEEISQWMPNDLHSIEAMTGNLLSISGAMPILAHRSVASPLGLKLMNETGIGHGSNILVYRDKCDYDSTVRSLCAAGKRAVFVYSQANAEFDSCGTIANKTLQYLNNKANIGKLAGVESVPLQRMLSVKKVEEINKLKVPIVLKVPTDDPNAGGFDVYVCRKKRHIARALKRFSNTSQIIAEQYIEARQNWCIQFSVSADAKADYLGASEQLCMSSGVHGGNIINTSSTVPNDAISVARRAVSAGAAKGFVGLCGVDVLIDDDRQAFAIDLNFRPVSSAAFLYAFEKLNRNKTQVFRLAFCTFSGSFDELASCCNQGFENGWLSTLASFDPVWGEVGTGDARIRLAIAADDQQQLIDREAQLRRAGLKFIPYQEHRIAQNGLGRWLSKIFHGRSNDR